VPGEGILGEGIGTILSVGLHRARIRATGDVLEMSIDENYTGSFTPTISSSIDLTLYPQIKTALLNDSHAFFGTALPDVKYDDFALVPEPTSATQLLIGLIAVVRRRR
jgi:hypothetical protein